MASSSSLVTSSSEDGDRRGGGGGGRGLLRNVEPTTTEESSGAGYGDGESSSAGDGDGEQPFFGGGGDAISTVVQQGPRPSYLKLDGGTGLMPSTHPFDMDVIKRLDSFFDDTLTEMLEEEKLKTFLRIRPATGTGASAVGGQQGGGAMQTRSFKNLKNNKVLEIKDNSTVIAYPVQRTHTSFLNNGGNAAAGSGNKQTEFKFTKVLGPLCGQSTVFDECINPLIERFLKNENCLIFTYGATNSGKTYTLQGHGEEYGILPRALYTIFNRIQDRLLKNGDIMPHLYQSFRHLSSKEVDMCNKTKERVLADAATIKQELRSLNQSQVSSKSESTSSLLGPKNYDEMNYALFANTTLFSVWVSYAEIYNERVYDLLETVHIGKNARRRKELKLMQDRNGFVYVKDLTEIHVTSEEEAYKIFLAGRQYLQFAATLMNQKSSRSHSFFTLRVVTVGVGEGLLLFPKSVHRLTFCDLAGMERVQQTENEGVRLKESSNINASLTVLLKVIRILREKQVHRNNMIETIPFRESKLTHIFKSYLTSSTHICMIVNVNPDPAMANSTLQVLHNSAIASNVIVFRPLERKKLKENFKSELKEGDFKKETKRVGFAEHKNQYVNGIESASSSQELDAKKLESCEFDSSSGGTNSDNEEDEPPSIVVRNRLLHERLAILEQEKYELMIENHQLKRKLERSELEKEKIREETIKMFVEQNRSYRNKLTEAQLQEQVFNARRMSLMRHQFSLSPGSKCGRCTPPILDMESILEEEDDDADVDQGAEVPVITNLTIYGSEGSTKEN